MGRLAGAACYPRHNKRDIGLFLFFLFLGWLVLAPKVRRGFWNLFTPVYWTRLSSAAWCAFIELWRRPHHWAKTPHRKARAF
jgi:hypothetical protein